MSKSKRRALILLPIVGALLVILAVVAVVVVRQAEGEPGPLSPDAPALADFELDTGRCSYEPDRGGLVGHFDVSSSDAGRFTVDLAAVTSQGLDDLDVTTTHVVRYTVPFYGGRTRQQFDVVVPLSDADYESGYRKCRYTVNPTGAD